jgi:hypothetical protein
MLSRKALGLELAVVHVTRNVAATQAMSGAGLRGANRSDRLAVYEVAYVLLPFAPQKGVDDHAEQHQQRALHPCHELRADRPCHHRVMKLA